LGASQKKGSWRYYISASFEMSNYARPVTDGLAVFGSFMDPKLRWE
jgi:hypothetical protein